MTIQKGTIDIKTENIFPIIKKFLYSDHEIFLRELISNATDASQKLKTLASMGKFKDELGDLTIQVEVDKKALELYDPKNPSKTREYLTGHTNLWGDKVIGKAWELSDYLWTKYDEKF